MAGTHVPRGRICAVLTPTAETTSSAASVKYTCMWYCWWYTEQVVYNSGVALYLRLPSSIIGSYSQVSPSPNGFERLEICSATDLSQ